MAVIIASIVAQCQGATGTVPYVVWAVGLALIGMLAWAVEVEASKKKSKKK